MEQAFTLYQKIDINVVLFSKHRIKHQYSFTKTLSANYSAQNKADMKVLGSKILNHVFHTPD